jgi:hypothetical protein
MLNDHTPAPWNISHDGDTSPRDGGDRWLNVGPARIDLPKSAGKKLKIARADAAIVSAAPEMYEFISRFVGIVSRMDRDSQQSIGPGDAAAVRG